MRLTKNMPINYLGGWRNAENVDRCNHHQSGAGDKRDRQPRKHLRRVVGKPKSEDTCTEDAFEQIRATGDEAHSRIAEMTHPDERPAFFRKVDTHLSGTDAGQERDDAANQHCDENAAARVARRRAQGIEQSRTDDQRRRKEHGGNFSYASN